LSFFEAALALEVRAQDREDARFIINIRNAVWGKDDDVNKMVKKLQV
jgi:hypothetical protein